MLPSGPRFWVVPLALGLFSCDCSPPKVRPVFEQVCVPETCDGFDEDCNGLVDDGLGTLKCGVGACAREIGVCVGGALQQCEPGAASTEVCNGLDDDCDGETDEGLAPLSCGVGACAREVASCVDGGVQTCVAGEPGDETCNGVDDDCDGDTDEALTPLSCGVGACAREVAACAAGVPQACAPGSPVAETCNGLDDDCDGATDEDLTPLSCGVGACARVLAACSAGAPQACTPGQPTAEVCNGRDDDCDGDVDEALPPLVCGRGLCERSVLACAGGVAQTCQPGQPSFEQCDGLDNDCDGAVDEDGICNPPVALCGAAQSTTLGNTVSLTATAMDVDGTIVSTQWLVTQRPAGSTATPTPANQADTSFTPDVAGTYLLTFCARDNAGTTTCCSTSVATTACTSPPSPPVSTACGTSWDGRPIVQFAPVPTGLVYRLTRAGDAVVQAQATAGQNYLRPAMRLAAGGPSPGQATALEVRACRDTDLSCCSAPSAVTVSIIEPCTTPVAPTSSNLVISEYVVNGEGSCTTPATCQAGEAVELTNLGNCPISLSGTHFAYRNPSATTGSYRWMNFGPAEVIPPRGVYVAIRGQGFCAASLSQTAESTGLYGLQISTLAMQGSNIDTGWFNNSGGGQSVLQIAPGTVPDGGVPSFSVTPIAVVAPYVGGTAACVGVGFNAVDSCGDFPGSTTPTSSLNPNQLGRLWHPCDAVTSPNPACVRD